MNRPVLLVDDDAAVREALGQTLGLGGYRPILAASFIEAKDHIAAEFAGVIVSDVRMPGKDGFDLLDYTRKIDPKLPVILLTGQGDIPTAVRGIREGADDFLEKPCEPKHLLEAVEKCLRTRALVLENRALKLQLDMALNESGGFLGTSAAAVNIREAIQRAGRSNMPVVLSGERGSGRGYVARLILNARGNSAGLRRLDCDNPKLSPPGTGAAEALLLCDLERLSASQQARLSLFLSGLPDAQVFATTGPNPEAMVHAGKLDDDLFYSLGVMRISVAPLRERREDIPVLFNKFLREEIDAGAPISDAAGHGIAAGLQGLDWQGNIRALRNHAKRVAWGLAGGTEELGLSAQLERVERGLIEDALRRNSGHASNTAKELGLPRKTFYDRLAKLGIRPEAFRL